MTLSNTEYGKAFEYACLTALRTQLEKQGVEQITSIASDAYRTARDAYFSADRLGLAEDLSRAAHAAARVLLPLEPQLLHGSGALTLSLQTDARGMEGDVRDVLCARDNGWAMGLSCKHNHHAVKHSRLSATIDFGAEWVQIPCSQAYFRTVVPIFHELRDMRAQAMRNGTPLPLWSNLPDKAERYYLPILRAFLEELRRLAAENPEVPGRLIHYLIGRNDFYKVITDDPHRFTRVEAINIGGTLNRPASGHRARVDVPPLRLPRRFFYMDIVPGSDNKVEVVCDGGWSLTMRIHNASSKVEPSLKFDVQLTATPQSVYAQSEPW